MTRSAAKRANGNARAIVAGISSRKADRWRDENGTFDEISSRSLARNHNLDVTAEINWTLAAEILNRQTAVEWL
jgi:post-segregation antitoxin (ccd killing protein)